MHDIYDPPPAPVPYVPLKPEPLVFTTGDLACLVTLCALPCGIASVFWPNEPTMMLMTSVGGSLVVLESWFTALGFLHRVKPLGLKARWTVFVAALVPWLVGLGIAATLMVGLFWISDFFT
jgi:hypothetical protein